MLVPRMTGVLVTSIALALFPPAARTAEPVDGAVLVENSPAEAWAIVFPLAGTAAASAAVDATPGVPAHVPMPADADAMVCAGAAGCATTCRVVRNTGAPARLPLVDGAHLRGRCMLGESPARGARVFLRPAGLQSRRPFALPLFRRDNGEIATSVTTDASGTFAIEHVAPGRYIAEIHLADGRIHESGTLVIDEQRDDPSPAVVELPPIEIPEGLRIVVQVRDREGAPLAGAGVGLSQRDGQKIVFAAETRTDDRGMAEVSGLVTDLPLSATCSARGFVRLAQRLPAPASTLECVLERFASISGSVASVDGTPLPATVSLVNGEAVAEAGADGRFRLSRVTPGADRLRVATPGYRVALRDVSVAGGEDADVGSIRLSKADVLNGRVIDAESRAPVHGAQVRVVQPSRSGGVVTDAEGRFSVPVDLGYGARLEAVATGYATATHEVAAGGAAPPDGAVIALARPGALEVMVWSGDGDSPCAGCTVMISTHLDARSDRTDGSGIVRFGELPPGTYQVTREEVVAGAARVHVSGGGTNRMATVRPRETTRIELGARNRSVDVALAPQPAADCRLSAVATSSVVAGERNPGTGLYRLPLRAGEAYRLQLVCGGSGARVGAVPAEFQGTLLTIPLGASSLIGSIAGTVPGSRDLTLRSVADGSLVAWTAAQPDGRFALRYLSPGTYSLWLPGAAEPQIVTIAGPMTDVGSIPVRGL